MTLELARRYNSKNYLLSGSFLNVNAAMESIAGSELFNKMLSRFQYKKQASRYFEFMNVSNKVSETIEKAYQNFERVFSANDKEFTVYDIKEETLKQIDKTIRLFESQSLPELKQANTIYVAIVNKVTYFDLLFLPVDSNFSIKKDKDSGEIISYHYKNTIEVTIDNVRIEKENYPNTTGIWSIFKLIEKEVKPGVSWSPTFGYLGSLEQLWLDLINIEYLKSLTQSISVTGEYTCGYMSESGNSCESGRVKTGFEDGKIIYDDCPECSLGVGAGQTIIVKPKLDEKVDIKNALAFVTPDINVLKENQQKFIEGVISVYEAMTGLRYAIETNASYENKSRITADFEKAKTIFTTLAKEFTRCEKFISNYITLTLENKVPDSKISLGTDFYLITKEDLIVQLSEAKKSGLPQFMINDIVRKLAELQFKDVSSSIDFQIWTALEPFAGYSIEEIKGIASQEDLRIKANFINLISTILADLNAASFFEYMTTTGADVKEIIKTIKNLLILKSNESEGNQELRREESEISE